jgi:hypothetical protein
MENATMKSLNMKLALAAVGIAMLSSPAFAQRPHHPSQQQMENSANAPDNVGTYPNGAQRSGSAESYESGAESNVIR